MIFKKENVLSLSEICVANVTIFEHTMILQPAQTFQLCKMC